MLIYIAMHIYEKKYIYNYEPKWYMVVLLGVSELIVEVGQSWGAAATARYPWICDVQLLDENHLNKYISNFRQIYFKI